MFLTALWAEQPHCFFALSQANHTLSWGGRSGRGVNKTDLSAGRGAWPDYLSAKRREVIADAYDSSRNPWPNQNHLPTKACQFTAASESSWSCKQDRLPEWNLHTSLCALPRPLSQSWWWIGWAGSSAEWTQATSQQWLLWGLRSLPVWTPSPKLQAHTV